MTKKCSCKNGKTDPKCPTCGKGDINLDSFHKLNPEAKPKTAEQFKLSFAMGPVATRAMQVGAAGLKGALPGALAGGALGFISAPEGEGMAGAARGAAAGGLATGGAAATHHGLMTGTGAASQHYQNKLAPEMTRNKNMQNLVQTVEQNRQRKENFAAMPAPEVKMGTFYDFGKIAALASFAI